jgi:UDP-GlcNAc:undecaprenyl-phosphate GlcNAc-1-phosphate transferase
MDFSWLWASQELSSVYIFASSFLICIAAHVGAIAVARRVGLLDYPDSRKRHVKPTPLVGGVCIYIALVLTAFMTNGQSATWSFIIWMGVVLAVGVVDDFNDISYLWRSVAHALVVAGVFITEGQFVSSVGAILSVESTVQFTVVTGLMFTVFAVLGAVNAINMIDGLDGLLGTIVLVSLAALLIVSMHKGDVAVSFLSPVGMLAVIGGVLAFLLLNARLPGRKTAIVFLGDSGSTLLGFILVYSLIAGTQGSDALFSPVVAGWFIGVPLLDASAVILKRVLRGVSPAAAGRDHMHHILLDRGMSPNAVLGIMVFMQIFMISFALLMEGMVNQSDIVLFWVFIGLVVVHAAFTYRSDKSVSTVEEFVEDELSLRVGTDLPIASASPGKTSARGRKVAA